MKSQFRFSLKLKMITTYFLLFIVIFSVIAIVINYNSNRIISKNIENQLTKVSKMIADTVNMTVETSIRTHLKTMTETNLIYVNEAYEQYLEGTITESEAKEKAAEFFLRQKVGSSGYIYVIDSQGIVLIHPKEGVTGQDVSDQAFVQKQIADKEGYIEYMWSNPEDQYDRKKSLYMTYFEPWDWIISISSYREEFYELVNMREFRYQIMNIQISESSYIGIMDQDGTFLIHPSYEGQNFILNPNPQTPIIQDLMDTKNGFLEYEWQNIGDDKPREKIALVTYLEDYGWYVIATSYKEDFYGQIEDLQYKYFIALSLGLLLLLITTSLLSQSIVKPIESLKNKVKKGTHGDLNVSVDLIRNDELGDLGRYFNQFIHTLRENQAALLLEIEQRKTTEKKLAQINEDLEQIVRLRTESLEQTIHNLHATQDELINTEKSVALSKIMADIAHHMNTPIGTTITLASYLDRQLYNLKKAYDNKSLSKTNFENFIQDMHSSLEKLTTSIHQSADLIEIFKFMSLDDQENMMTFFNIQKCLEEVLSKVVTKYPYALELVSIQCDPDLYITANKTIYLLIFEELIINALVHGIGEKTDGIIKVTVQREADNLIIEIADNGNGIEKDDLPHIFEPFFSSNQRHSGFGLGLNLIYKVVSEILRGSIECQSQVGSGTTILMNIPL